MKYHGVGLRTRSELGNDIDDINRRRIMFIKPRGAIPMAIINAYAPTAEEPGEGKDKFNNTLKEECREA